MDCEHRVRHLQYVCMFCVVLWLLYSALEATSLLGGTGLSPFYAMLEGGREGGFFAELEDYFYYAQIRRYTLSRLCVHPGPPCDCTSHSM